MTRLSLVFSVLIALSACGKDAPKPPEEVKEAPLPPLPPSAVSAENEGEKADPTKITPGFVRIPAGRFAMGSPPGELKRSKDERQHQVTIRWPFEIAATEVTQADYKALIGKNPANNKECGGRCPVEQVSWFEAVHYCNELSRRRKLPLCYVENGLKIEFKGVACGGYRLPTEAEWEYAARGGSPKARHGELNKVAWYDLNAKGQSHPVASKRPNRYGVYDALGNVFEWVWDWQAPYPVPGAAPTADPIGPPTGDNRVFRGGAYKWTGGESRAAFRNAYGPKNKVEWIGFRCARSLR
ncbi:MAG: formylglycine-generating enzyme family protein [Myxococcales bacterium]|nr:formylglycine-generating enzyme family protein [Myxococcales bacterium]